MEGGKLLVVGSTSITSWGHDQLLRIAAQARRRGLGLIGMDLGERIERAERRSRENELFDELLAADIDDPESSTAAVTGRQDLSAVLTIRELSVAPVAAIAQRLGLRGNAPAVISRIRNKDQCRDWLRARGFAQPPVRLCSSAQEAQEYMLETVDGPWIVKPRDALASIGVSLLRGREELAAAIERIGLGERFLIETFVDGHEFSAEGVMLGGRAQVLSLTRKTLDGSGGFIAAEQRQPAGLSAEIAALATREVQRAVEAVGITYGHFHVEMWVTHDGVVLGELHARSGGDFIHLMVDETHPGLSMFGLLIDDLLGRRVEHPIAAPSGAAAVTFLPFPSGTITAIDGWEAIRDDAHVVACDLQVGIGDTIAATVGSFDRPAVIVVSAPTIAEVEAVTDRLRSRLVVSTS
jgi:glutathione synthase/RimK-type ligase-like ATP-grasp enzyme